MLLSLILTALIQFWHNGQYLHQDRSFAYYNIADDAIIETCARLSLLPPLLARFEWTVGGHRRKHHTRVGCQRR